MSPEFLNDLIICGAMTHMCIDTTVRLGFDMGYNIELSNDVCTTRDLVFHNETIKSKDVYFSFKSAGGSVFCQVKSTREVINVVLKREFKS